MTERDIVITGIGTVSSNGLSYEEFVDNCLSGKTGIKHSERIDTSELRGHFVGEIDYDKLMEKVDFTDMYDKTTYLVYCATLEALKQAGISSEYLKGKNVAVVVGTLFGSYNALHDIQKSHYDGKDFKDLSMKDFEYFFPCALPDFLCKKFELNGPRIIVSNACSSGGSAVGIAYDLIKSGAVDMAIAGGTDELNTMCLGGFSSLGAISSQHCAPYVNSRGINIGEGSSIFVMEKGDAAEERNAEVHAKILGYYLNSDAYHITTPNPKGEGAYNVMKKVLELNNIPLEDIDFINGHGTGTKANDVAEVRAINQLFEGSDCKVKLTSNKANIGHCMGAAGAVEIAGTIGALEKKLVTPVFGTGEKEAEHVHVVMEKEPVEKPVALSNSFAFGGNNVSVALSDVAYKHDPVEYVEQPVVITGIGCMGNNHVTFEELQNVLLNAPVDFEKSAEGEGIYQGRIPEINYKQYMSPDMIRKTDALTKMAVVTSQRAILDANITISNDNSNDIGHVYASSTGPFVTVNEINEGIFERGIGKVNPFSFPNSVFNAAPGYVTMNSRIKGATITLSAGSASLSCSLLYAQILINSKKAEKVVVTVADNFNDVSHVAYNHFGLLSANGNINDFTNSENTVVPSTGSVSFVVESKESAEARGQKIYAEIVTSKISGNVSDVEEGILEGSLSNYDEVLEKGLNSIGLSWNEIDLYCSPCCGISKYDKKEKELVWDKLPENVGIVSLKPFVGYNISTQSAYSLLGAINAFQTDSAWVVKDGKLEEVKKSYHTAILGSYAFGNTVGCTIIRKA